MGSKFIRYVINVLILCIAYIIAAKIGLSLGPGGGFATPIWPPSGIALAALLLYGYRLWPGIAIAVFLVHIQIEASPLIVTIGSAAAATLEALLGAYLLKRLVGFDNSLNRAKDVLGLVILAALISSIVSTFISVGTMFFSSAISPATFPKTWVDWWIGDMIGILVVTPMILVWAKQPRVSLTFKKLREPILAAVVLIMISVAIFSGMLSQNLESSTYEYLLLLPLIWIAFRFGQRGNVIAIFIVSVVAILSTITAAPPQSDEILTQSLVLVQRFIGINAFAFMMLSAIIAEREFAENSRRRLLKETIRLNKQGKYLKKLNIAKDEFISLASHQLRTPASGVKIYLGVLLENLGGKLTKKQQNIIMTAYRFNEREIQMIDALLNVAQIDMGNIDIQKEEADMTLLVSNVIDAVATDIAEREQTIEFVHNQDNYVAKVDKGKISIILENLIDNASKYSPPGKKIEVNLSNVKNSLRITIKDEGVGIAKKDIGKLFKKFSRIHNNLSIARGGNGLGLYWVNKIIKLHGGTINVTSKLGHGSVFTLII